VFSPRGPTITYCPEAGAFDPGLSDITFLLSYYK
jgi:hypothetical protein